MLELFLSIGYAAFFVFLIGKMKIFRTEAIPTHTYKLLFLVKLAAGFFLYLIYTRYYPIAVLPISFGISTIQISCINRCLPNHTIS
ncbi:MAG TPA: hypothetical protein PLH61_11105, partial [Bacteroidia bacterium]|nr:hypothetical protein [Bacteroidia bacterium]